MKNYTYVDTSNLAAQRDVVHLKVDFDKLDIDKLVNFASGSLI